ncbi:MAG: hypothetical protein V2I27_02035 [Erythrobacter sp.]|jgi:flagellin-specific chaperone FliS|nr:hypothetical protein [Erythrobacter sp.]
MHQLARNAASAYRRVELDARIEASPPSDLARICLEEAVSALGQALIALERAPGEVPREALARAQAIAVWLARSVAPDHPLRLALLEFYGGIAAALARNLVRARYGELARVRDDLNDLLEAARR